MTTPAIQTARLRALRGAEDPSLSVRMRQAQRIQAARPQQPMQYPQQQQAQSVAAPTQRIQTQPQQQPQPQMQPMAQSQEPQNNEIVAQALRGGVVNTIRQKASELARLRAERDYEQGQTL